MTPHTTFDHPLHSSFFSPLFWPWKLSWKTWPIWIKHFICRFVNWAHQTLSNILWGDTSVQWGSNWFSRLLSMYSKTAWVQSCAAQWEVRSLSIPFIHSVIQLEGNYRPPWGFKILVGFCSHQGALLCRIPLDCTGWCLYRCVVCKTPEQAAANRQERFKRLRSCVSLQTAEVVQKHVTLRKKLLSL